MSSPTFRQYFSACPASRFGRGALKRWSAPLLGLIFPALLWTGSGASDPPAAKDDGYRGIWYANQPSGDQYQFKYSGGMATYPQQHVPIAVHAPAVQKTFFCYGGAPRDRNELLHMVSYFDHRTGQVPRPTILLNKKTDDAHDNPTLSIDAAGHLWIFSNSHGTSRPSYIHRSSQPYSIDRFERIVTSNFSYGQPWFIAGRGFLFLHTRYSPGRFLFWSTSPDGTTWSEPQPLAQIARGHYQISWPQGERVGTAFNFHPEPVGLNARTNLYYLSTSDLGATWVNAAGENIAPPLTEEMNGALVHDYRREGLLVYLKDLQFDEQGRPIILYLTSRGYAAGPDNGPRLWRTARWTGGGWDLQKAVTSDNNYDFGSLYVERDGIWRLIAPTEAGPQPYNPGGEIVIWISRDRGVSWEQARTLTRASSYNHTYVRRPLNAHPDFYALWADGHARQLSSSRLYFTDREGRRVWRLPEQMSENFQAPQEWP